jgi:nucleoside-diphosphate kinase
MEQSLVIFKPDALENAQTLLGSLIDALPGKMIAGRLLYPDVVKTRIYSHYSEHFGKPYFDSLINFMLSGPIMVCIYEGFVDSIRTVAQELRQTYPCKSPANWIHSSDSVESAVREIGVWKDLL